MAAWLGDALLPQPPSNFLAFPVCLRAWADVSSGCGLSGSLCRGQHGLLRVPVSPGVGHAASKWQGDELRAGAPSCPYDAHANSLREWVVVDVVSHGVSPPDVDFVLLALAGGFAVDWVVKVHAFCRVATPVTPHQVDSGADQAEHHCGNDRNCMRLTHSGRDMGRGALTRRSESMEWNESSETNGTGMQGQWGRRCGTLVFGWLIFIFKAGSNRTHQILTQLLWSLKALEDIQAKTLWATKTIAA